MALGLTAAALAACSGGGSSTGSGGGGGGGGSPPVCDPGSHLGESGVCEATLAEWITAPLLNEARDHHVTFAVPTQDDGWVLHVLAGVQNMTTAVMSGESAPINSDGSLGAFTLNPGAGEVMYGPSVAVVDGYVILTGGLRPVPGGLKPSRTTNVAPINADGSLGAFVQGTDLGLGRFHHAMIAVGTTLYVTGGLAGAGTDNTALVERATVMPDGTLSAWEALTPLPDKRSHHGLAVAKDALYVTGGLKGDPANNPVDYKDVLRAPLNADGTLGAWSVVSDLPVSLGTHASFVHLDFLYVAAGVEGNATNTPAVRRARVNDDGSLGAWEDALAMPKKHAHTHQTPVVGGFVYSAGGAVNHMSLKDVYIGRFE